MKNNRYISTSSKTIIKTKKNSFRMSVFWVAAGMISVVGFAAYQIGQNPQWLTKEYSSQEINKKISPEELKREQLSTEDLSLGADLGDLDQILKEIEENKNLPSATNINNSSVDSSNIPTKSDSAPSFYPDGLPGISSGINLSSKGDEERRGNQFQPSSKSISKYKTRPSFSNQTNSTKHFLNNQISQNSGQKMTESSSLKVDRALSHSQLPNNNALQITPQKNQNRLTHPNTTNSTLITTPSILRSQSAAFTQSPETTINRQANPLNSPINLNRSTSQPSSLNSYQIPLLGYNPLVPTNYQSSPPLQPNRIVPTDISNLNQANF